MVSFRLVQETLNSMIYWYFPEGNIDEGYGIITIHKCTDSIEITKLASNDFSKVVTMEEQNNLRDSINSMRREETLEELTEEEWPSAKESFVSAFYADHVISKIAEAYDNGETLREGRVIWY